MNEGIAVQQFHRAAGPHGPIPLVAEHPGGFDAEEGPQSLSASQSGVTQSIHEPNWPRYLAGTRLV